jgi:hypothetical protein
MIGMEILQPAVVLMAWTLVMLVWLYATRIPAMSKGKVDLDQMPKNPEMTLDRALPPEVQWKAHNYAHLHEAPTVFYAVVIVLAMVGQSNTINLWLAWGYVGLRILHSLVQATVNKIMVRFSLFILSSLVLVALVLHAAMAVFA